MLKTFVNVMFLVAVATGASVPAAYAAEPAKVLTKTEAKALIRTATTPADHLKLAAYYHAEANQLNADAKEHEEMAAEYYRSPINHPIPKYPTLGDHCRALTDRYREAGKTAAEMAALHEELARSK